MRRTDPVSIPVEGKDNARESRPLPVAGSDGCVFELTRKPDRDAYRLQEGSSRHGTRICREAAAYGWTATSFRRFM
jgi:hypothetical protein